MFQKIIPSWLVCTSNKIQKIIKNVSPFLEIDEKFNWVIGKIQLSLRVNSTNPLVMPKIFFIYSLSVKKRSCVPLIKFKKFKKNYT
jgi:hypothetical protein